MQTRQRSLSWIFDLLLIVVLLIGAYFRLIGPNWTLEQLWLGITQPGQYAAPELVSDWDQSQHLHPDERFLTMVSSAISPIKGCNLPDISIYDCPNSEKIWLSVSDYFNTLNSPLNPNNRGYGFYVYGTLPLFIVRYAGELVGMTGYDEINLVGRQLSALIDLGSVFLLYLLASRLYGRRVGLLAAAFSALAVAQIQQSHFFTVDNFPTFFMLLSAYFALDVSLAGRMRLDPAYRHEEVWLRVTRSVLTSGLFWYSILFGLATGMAMASKLNAAPVAGLLPLALLLHFWRTKDQPEPQEEQETDEETDIEEANEVTGTASTASRYDYLWTLTGFLVLGAFFTIISFRIFQPYAFSGPGFFGVAPNAAWVQTISEQRSQASGDVDFPPALQWARRSVTFSLENIVKWGLGWSLGILACLGFIFMGWRSLRGEWPQHILLWFWTGAYLAWQSMEWNPTMRYQLPIYPLLAMMAAWLIFNGPRWKVPRPENGERTHPLAVALYSLLGLAVLLSTFGWAYAFTRIYTREHSRVQATRWIYQNIPGPINLHVEQDGLLRQQPMPLQNGLIINSFNPYVTQFNSKFSGPLQELSFAYALDPLSRGAQAYSFILSNDFSFTDESVLARSVVQVDLYEPGSLRGKPLSIRFDPVPVLEAGQNYYLRIETSGELVLAGSAPVNETSWDDGLPLRMDGYDGYGGIYVGELNFEMYWDDNADKLERFVSNLDAGDYVFISSNRQWGTTTRVPERYPLTTAYYRALLGCPPDSDILWCYSVARPGMFQEQLGYELIQTFESYPTLDLGALGFWEFNTQFAEEAFTVYDHPKVLLFKKTDAYNPQSVRDILGEVDLTRVVRLTPRKASSYRGAPSGEMLPRTCFGFPGICDAFGASDAAPLVGADLSLTSNSLQLSAERRAVQQAGGTWSDLFSYEAVQNKVPFLGLLLWYSFLTVLGLATYPLLRLLLPGLLDGGYPLARLVGLVLLAWLSWFPASLGGVYTRSTILASFGTILLAGLLAGWFKRDALRAELRARGRHFLLVEGIFLAFFVIDLLIRVGNPDLWHPAKGGERPMDFAYFNAILKSTTFPPYDPWFAGGYINYYYYGFVLVGTPVKLLAIVPSIAYNFILPSLFAMLALGGFSVAWNFFSLWKKDQKPAPLPELPAVTEQTDAQDADVPLVVSKSSSIFDGSVLAGISAALGLVLLGNLGTIQLIFQHLQKQVVDYETFASRDVWMIERLGWALQGIYKSMIGQAGGIPMDQWYWNPSRVMPPGDFAITEFPLFTFLYSDLHAHMIALPLTVLALAWALSTLFARNLKPWSWLATLAFGGLVLGALRPTNTWDLPTYLVFALLVTGYAIFRYVEVGPDNRFGLHPVIQRLLLALAAMAALAAFVLLFYQPYARWFGLGYTEVRLWENEKTPIWSYWTQWGLFLFIIFFWMTWETRHWMAQTPVSALSKLKPFKILIELALVLLAVLVLVLVFYTKTSIAWFCLPLAVWALLLMFRPGMSDAKRMALFMIGTALAVTLGVDIVVIAGDRMNTVFKFYVQGWVLFAISAAAALAWTLSEFEQWNRRWRNVWLTGMFLLAGSAFLFTLTATSSKIQDRMAPNLPNGLDSMQYMAHTTYWDKKDMDLSQDYRAIRWMQDNIKGSPVIVEGAPAGVQYTWFSRFSIYTGLPTVVGWQWHQEQQRILMPYGSVARRGVEVQNFYNAATVETALEFLEKYDVCYIVVGQVERNHYTPEGLSKFELHDGRLWLTVYRDADTVIYEVIR